MRKLERYLPGFNHILCGKPPRTTFTEFEEKLRKLRQSTLSELATIFADYVPADMLQSKEEGKNSRIRNYSYGVTFWAFLHQVLTPNMPCREVVPKVQIFCSQKKLPLPSSNDAAYYKARARINDTDLELIHDKVTAKVQQRVLEDQRWKARDVKVLDGTGITLADTPENLESGVSESKTMQAWLLAVAAPNHTALSHIHI